jgi:hypothetical protein
MIRWSATALSAFILGAAPALADPFNINISNGESSILLLTVTDMNYPSPTVAYSGSINSGQMMSVNINGESGHNGHIKWSATSSDRSKCGSGDVSSLSSGSNLTVNTPSSC